MAIVFNTTPNLISLMVKNLTEDTLFLLWNECSFTFPEGLNSKITHSKLAYASRNIPLKYMTILPMKELKIYLAPTTRVSWNRITKKWRSTPILEGNFNHLIFKTFTLNLKFDKKGEFLLYPFVFRVDDTKQITLPQKKPDSPTTGNNLTSTMSPDSRDTSLTVNPDSIQTVSPEHHTPPDSNTNTPIIEESIPIKGNSEQDTTLKTEEQSSNKSQEEIKKLLKQLKKAQKDSEKYLDEED
ncbi:MAG: hypothetical protein HQK83_06645 [Fibrobacteria bacterium]|nr:hypothetical protein [Fibrobacteria bacterium]